MLGFCNLCLLGILISNISQVLFCGCFFEIVGTYAAAEVLYVPETKK